MVVKALASLVLGTVFVVLPSMSVAQVSRSCPEQLRETEIDRSVLELHLRQLRQTMATELRQALERAEKAEQALAKVQDEAKPKPGDAAK